MMFSFKGWKSPAVKPFGVIPRESWWPIYAQSMAVDEIPGRVMGDFLFKNGKAYAIEEGKERELSLWK